MPNRRLPQAITFWEKFHPTQAFKIYIRLYRWKSKQSYLKIKKKFIKFRGIFQIPPLIRFMWFFQAPRLVQPPASVRHKRVLKVYFLWDYSTAKRIIFLIKLIVNGNNINSKNMSENCIDNEILVCKYVNGPITMTFHAWIHDEGGGGPAGLLPSKIEHRSLWQPRT